MSLYEGMFLLDNAVVREDWKTAKGLVTEALAKHGGTVRTARRFDERRLAYKIKGKNRATYLLCYFELPAGGMPALRRELELSERVLRNLILRVDAIPEAETELHAAEQAEGFSFPAPPPDDMADSEIEPAAEGPGEEPEPAEDEESGSKEEEAEAEVAS